MTLTKEIWRQKWLYSINELTSLDLQTNSWLNLSNKNPHWTFIEFMCSYFDDLANKENYVAQLDKGWITKEESEVVKVWHDALDKYEAPNKDDYDNKSVLNDPKWLDTMRLGIIAKNKLLDIISIKEKRYLFIVK